jgi:ribosomal protein S18 acetylase RimI-like enzyme
MEANKPTKRTVVWRPLSVDDIASLVQVADRVHPDLPESNEVFAERATLFPQGCLGLFDEASELRGYIVSHPIRYREPPTLDQLLGGIAPDADQYYIHDLAILPEMRGSGLAHECLNKLLETVAKRYATTGLVSVYGTAGFWGRYEFATPKVIDELLKKKATGYGKDAVYLERKNEAYVRDQRNE